MDRAIGGGDSFKPSVQERRRETKGSRTWLPPIKQYDVNLLYLLLILSHLLLSLFKTCPTDFDDTLIQIKYHMHVGKLTNYKLRVHKIHRDATC